MMSALTSIFTTVNCTFQLYHLAVITTETGWANASIGLTIRTSNILTFAIILADIFVILTELEVDITKHSTPALLAGASKGKTLVGFRIKSAGSMLTSGINFAFRAIFTAPALVAFAGVWFHAIPILTSI